MPQPTQGAIDCDVHVSVPSVATLLPYCDDYWRDQFRIRGIDRLDFSLTAYPPNAPLSGRPDWRPKQGAPGTDLDLLRAHLDRFGLRAAIAQCLHGSVALHSEDMAAAFCRAINDWMRAESAGRRTAFVRRHHGTHRKAPNWRRERSTAVPPIPASSRSCCPP